MEHAARPGLIPVQLDPVHSTARWMDLNGYHCYNGSFRRALAEYETIRAAAHHPSTPWQCISTLDFLRTGTDTDPIHPNGFIFHAGRCGSTLLAKVLARSREHLVFGEGGPHNQIWRIHSAEPKSLLFRNLLLYMGRRRVPSHRAHIVKLTSFNVVQFETIRTAFPEVPALFLFRKPAAVLTSYHRSSPAWMGRDLGVGTVWHSAETAVADFFHAALNAGKGLACLDYASLTPDALPAILRFFHLDPSAADLQPMRAEFDWDSKRNSRWSPHPNQPDIAASPGLQADYEELRARAIIC